MKKIAIIGGGITGLSAGWELKKNKSLLRSLKQAIPVVVL